MMPSLKTTCALFASVVLLAGCASTDTQNKPAVKESPQEVQSAIEAVAEGIISAPRNIRYCPKDGKRFSSQVEQCPDHGVPLKPLDE